MKTVHCRLSKVQPADAAPEPPEGFDPARFPILAEHWPGLPTVADFLVAHLVEPARDSVMRVA